jgi:hypothetical protein
MSNYEAVVLLHHEKLCHPEYVLFPAENPNGQFRLSECSCHSLHLLLFTIVSTK